VIEEAKMTPRVNVVFTGIYKYEFIPPPRMHFPLNTINEHQRRDAIRNNQGIAEMAKWKEDLLDQIPVNLCYRIGVKDLNLCLI